jgi:hypothetical protein
MVPDDNRDDYIRVIAPKRSFLEIGGLWGEVNEKATVAFQAGSTEIGVLDIWSPESEWWTRFHARCSAVGLKGVKEFVGSIDNAQAVEKLGMYDIVHCSGVLYHCPNPFLSLAHLRKLTGERLLLATAVMPPVIENEFGRLALDADAAILVPCLTEDKRRVIERHVAGAYGGVAYGVSSPIECWFFRDGAPNYGAWWWLWTEDYVRRMILASGFAVERSAPQFDGTGHLYLLRKTDLSTENFSVY